MRGYPLLQLVLVGCLFVAAGFPVWKLTRHAPAGVPVAQGAEGSPAPAASPSPAGETKLDVRVSLTPAPADFRLTYLGRVVLEGRGPQADFQGVVSVPMPKEGVDFALEAHWPAPETGAGHAAARVTFQFPDGHTAERTVWSDTGGAMVELVTVTP